MEHEFYKLDEAAELLKCTVLDLLKRGMTGKIDLCIWCRGKLDRHSIPDNAFTGRPAPEKNVKVDELLPILKTDIKELVYPSAPCESHAIMHIMWPGCDRPLYVLEDIGGIADTEQLITITKNDLFITNKTLNTLKDDLHKSPEKLKPQCFANIKDAPRKGGAKKHPFQAAIEKAYLYFRETEKSYILKKGNRVLFVKEIDNLLKRENVPCPRNEQKTIDYLAERIDLVKKTSGTWKITTQEFQKSKTRGGTNTQDSCTYELKDVSKQLTLLREKYPLPLQDSHS